MTYLIRIQQQTILVDASGVQDTDDLSIKLSEINYTPVEIVDWKNGQPLFDKTGDLCYFIGKSENEQKGVVQYAGSHNAFHVVDWDELEVAP